MTSDSGGGGSGGRRRGRISENAKSLAAVFTGIAALLTAVAGMVTLVRSDPVADPASAATMTVSVDDTPAAGGRTGSALDGATSPGASGSGSDSDSGSASNSSPGPGSGTDSSPGSGAGPSPSVPPQPVPQWQGDVQVDSLGYSLATVPPSPDQSGNPDMSAAFDGTFFAALGAAQWTSPDTPNPRACATLILARYATHVRPVLGDMYCVRVAHSPDNPGSQYAAVRIVGQGRDATNFPYVRIHAMVWPDEG